MEKLSGIYAFIYKDEYFYVGQSVNIPKRVSNHKKDILLKRHKNLIDFDDYDIKDFKFIVLEYCNHSELNEKEIYYFDLYKKTHKSLNNRECGLQGNPDFLKEFNTDVDIDIKYIDGNFYIGGFIINKKGKLHSLSDLCSFIENNSNFNIRINEIINKKGFIEKVCTLKNINSNENLLVNLKKYKVYKTVGARDTKKVYCDYDLFITFLYESCPQLSSALIIYMTNLIFVNNLKAIESI